MPGKRKVVILGSAYPLRGGGIATYNERLARAFQDNGDDVSIYNFKLQYPGFLFPGKTQYSDEEAPADLKIFTKVNSVNPINWLIVGNELKKLRPDVLVVRYWLPFMGPCLGTICGRVRKNNHTIIVAITDNVIPHENRPGDKQFTNYFLKRVDAFVTMSKSVLNDLNTFDTEKPRVFCHHPLYDNFGEPVSKEIARKELDIDPGSKCILFFGFIRDYKGLDLLLHAMADKKIQDLNIKLIVAGEFYTDPKPYNSIIEKAGISGNVVMKNEFIPNADVYKYFCACDLVVQPYKDATQSGVTQVAYHFNKPMVVSNVGALPEMVEHDVAGYVVNPEAEEIVDSITDYYMNDREEEFVRNVKIEKKKFSWENMISAIDSLVIKLRKPENDHQK